VRNVDRKRKPIDARRPAGFSLLEVMVAMSILLIVSGTVISAMIQMTKVEGSVTNQTEMHTSVRNATELLAQEVGQAGRVGVPNPITLKAAVVAPAGPATPATVAVSSAVSLFQGEKIVVDTGGNTETVTLIKADPIANTITAPFNLAHAKDVPVSVQGSFVSGIVPPSFPGPGPGSTATILKLYGDINGDGILQYVEYTCDVAGGNFYRNIMPLTGGKKAVDQSMILINNIQPNPGGTPCFTYQEKTVQNSPINAVVNVGITLTVQTQYADPQTHKFVTESKALLNVAPRNIFYGWQMGNAGMTDRMQPMPPSVLALL
jgi:prepilin-type N-terminal cleavage/methylation domain-containing protein